MAEVVNPELDILVPAHNHLELTIRCIETLYKYTAAPFHLIVTDDSTDGLTPLYFDKLQKEHPNMTYVRSEKPYTCGNNFTNVALGYCKTPYMAMVVNSMTVEPDWEVAALHLIKSDPKVGVVALKCLKDAKYGAVIESAGLMITQDGASLRDIGAGQASHRLSKVYECMAVQFAFVIMRKEALVGNLNETLFYGFRGMEDIDNCFVIRSKGWKILYCGLGTGYHETYATRNAPDEESLRQNLENKELFAKRWGFWTSYQRIFPYLGELLPDVKPRCDTIEIMKTVAENKKKIDTVKVNSGVE